jgi:hypothetical protein
MWALTRWGWVYVRPFRESKMEIPGTNSSRTKPTRKSHLTFQKHLIFPVISGPPSTTKPVSNPQYGLIEGMKSAVKFTRRRFSSCVIH